MNNELLKRIAHYLYSHVNLMYEDGMVSDDLLLAVGKAFNRLYNMDDSHQYEDDALLFSVCCHDTAYFTHGKVCNGCARMDAPIFADRVNEIMAEALLRELRAKGVDVTEFLERKNNTDKNDLPKLIAEINKALKTFYPIPSLELLCAQTAIKNKEQWRHSNVMIPCVLFAKYPALEIDPERLVSNQLNEFLLRYEPEALEARVLIGLSMILRHSSKLYADVHRLLTDSNYKNYTAYMTKNCSNPLIAAMKRHKDNLAELTEAIRGIIKNYKPQSVETVYLFHLIFISTVENKSQSLKKLLANNKLTNKMNEHLLQVLRKPLVDMLAAKDKLALEQARPH